MSIKLLDTIYKLTDNADKVDGKHASDFATSGHTHSSLSTVGDKRAEATTPNSYSNKFIFQGLKTNSSFGSPSTDTYSYVLGLRGWSDSSGGNSWELAFNNSGIYSRNGASTSWGNWYRLLDSSNSSVSKSGQTLTVKINGTSQSLSNTTYSAGTGLSLSGTTFNHASSVTAGTIGTSSATSGSTLAVPYVTYNATGHITATGTHTHTITGFASSSHNHDSVYLKLSGGTLTGNFAANNNTKTPFNLTTNLYYVNKALNWGGSSFIRNVILLIPVQTSTNWSGYNYIDGKFLLWKNGGNVYDIVEVNLNNVYNSLEYRLLASGQYSSSYKLCICKYNGVSYYAIDCPYHSNPYNNAEFYGHIRSSLTGGTGTVNLPLTVDYYNENTQTVLNSEVKNSITSTLTTSVVTSVSSRNLFSIAGFSGSLSGNASSASKLGTNAGSATNPVYFSGGVPVACTYSLNKTVPSDAKFTDTNTTYSAGTGISLSGTTFSNSGVRSVATGDNNGTIKVNTNGTSANVAVKGLGSAAYLNTTGTFSAVTHSDYNNNQTQLVSRSFMSHWTGAYNSSGTSNLTYCKHGAFGTAATKAYTTSVTSGSGSLVTSGGVYTALRGYSTTSHNHDSVYAAKSHTHSYVSYGTVSFTPKNEAITPAAVLALTGNWSLKKGTWDYSSNGYVTSDFGNIDLAGTSVLTFGTSSAYTQLYITAPTQSGHSGITNEMLFYNNHGSNFSPGWTRVITNRNYTSYCAKASHSHSYASKVTVGSTAYSVSSNNITIPAYPTSLKCPSSLTIQTNGTSQGAWNGSSAKTINITYSNVGAAAASHTHSYAGSSSAGGAATSANKLNTNAGDSRSPVYFSSGVPVACSDLDLRKYYSIDASSLSTSNFYPVTFASSDIMTDCEIHSPNLGGSQPYNQNVIHFQLIAQGWSDTPKSFKILHHGVYSGTEITIGAIGSGDNSGMQCVWVRGGMVYRFYSNKKPTLRTANTSNGNEIFTVGTGYSGGSNTKVTIHWSYGQTSQIVCTAGHTHNYASSSHNHDSVYSKLGHTHSYAASSHTHTKSQITDFSHTHNYAGSSSAGGDANNSVKWGGYKIVVGSTGTATDTIYIVT